MTNIDNKAQKQYHFQQTSLNLFLLDIALHSLISPVSKPLQKSSIDTLVTVISSVAATPIIKKDIH